MNDPSAPSVPSSPRERHVVLVTSIRYNRYCILIIGAYSCRIRYVQEP